jgi:hypothetical protein
MLFKSSNWLSASLWIYWCNSLCIYNFTGLTNRVHVLLYCNLICPRCSLCHWVTSWTCTTGWPAAHLSSTTSARLASSSSSCWVGHWHIHTWKEDGKRTKKDIFGWCQGFSIVHNLCSGTKVTHSYILNYINILCRFILPQWQSLNYIQSCAIFLFNKKKIVFSV